MSEMQVVFIKNSPIEREVSAKLIINQTCFPVKFQLNLKSRNRLSERYKNVRE